MAFIIEMQDEMVAISRRTLSRLVVGFEIIFDRMVMTRWHNERSPAVVINCTARQNASHVAVMFGSRSSTRCRTITSACFCDGAVITDGSTMSRIWMTTSGDSSRTTTLADGGA